MVFSLTKSITVLYFQVVWLLVIRDRSDIQPFFFMRYPGGYQNQYLAGFLSRYPAFLSRLCWISDQFHIQSGPSPLVILFHFQYIKRNWVGAGLIGPYILHWELRYRKKQEPVSLCEVVTEKFEFIRNEVLTSISWGTE